MGFIGWNYRFYSLELFRNTVLFIRVTVGFLHTHNGRFRVYSYQRLAGLHPFAGRAYKKKDEGFGQSSQAKQGKITTPGMGNDADASVSLPAFEPVLNVAGRLPLCAKSVRMLPKSAASVSKVFFMFCNFDVEQRACKYIK